MRKVLLAIVLIPFVLGDARGVSGDVFGDDGFFHLFADVVELFQAVVVVALQLVSLLVVALHVLLELLLSSVVDFQHVAAHALNLCSQPLSQVHCLAGPLLVLYLKRRTYKR